MAFSYMETSRGVVSFLGNIPSMREIHHRSSTQCLVHDYVHQLEYIFRDGTVFCALLNQWTGEETCSLEEVKLVVPQDRIRIFLKEYGKIQNVSVEHLLFCSYFLQWTSGDDSFLYFPIILNIILLLFQLPTLPSQLPPYPQNLRILELIHSECEYIRDLVILYLFRLRCSQNHTTFDLDALFPNILELIQLHMNWISSFEYDLQQRLALTNIASTPFYSSLSHLEKFTTQPNALDTYINWMSNYIQSSQKFRDIEKEATGHIAVTPNSERRSLPLIRKPTLSRWPSHKSTRSVVSAGGSIKRPNRSPNTASASPSSPSTNGLTNHIYSVDPLFRSSRDVDFYLTKPVQRICKYHLFIEELKKQVQIYPDLRISFVHVANTWNDWMMRMNSRLDGHEKAKTDMVVLKQLMTDWKRVNVNRLGPIRNKCSNRVAVTVDNGSPKFCQLYFFAEGVVFMHTSNQLIHGFLMFSEIIPNSVQQINEVPFILVMSTRLANMTKIMMEFIKLDDFLLTQDYCNPHRAS